MGNRFETMGGEVTQRRGVATEGSEMVKRRLHEREKSNEEIDSFGSTTLEQWKFLQHRGKLWKRYTRMYGVNPKSKPLAELLEKSKNLLPERVLELNTALVTLARKDPELFTGVVSRYFQSARNLEETAKKYNFDYAQDDEIDYFVREELTRAGFRGDVASTNQNYKRARRMVIIHELSEVFKNQYRDGIHSFETADALMPILERHAMWVAEQERLLAARMEQFREQVLERLYAAIGSGKLPFSRALIDERLGALKMTMVDGLQAKLSERWGDFTDLTHTIRMSTEVPDDKQFHVFVHEIFHALSGQSEVVEQSIIGEQHYKELDLSHPLRVGLRFGDTVYEKVNGTASKRRMRLNWLNEALTEQGVMDLLGTKKSWAYQKERYLLAHLIEAGISKELLYRAYFENYRENPRGGHRTPAIKELFDTIQETCGTGFLSDLDYYIRQKGAADACEQWKKRGAKKFSQYLRQFISQAPR